jgi:hypothetical protein
MNHPSFDKAASLILDAVEQVFEIVAPGGRGETHQLIVRILDYYCVPKAVSSASEQKGGANQ